MNNLVQVLFLKKFDIHSVITKFFKMKFWFKKTITLQFLDVKHPCLNEPHYPIDTVTCSFIKQSLTVF